MRDQNEVVRVSRAARGPASIAARQVASRRRGR